MQLVANGPDIPDVLIDAHEEGHVVFFCGAGISYPAGLPGFKELVDAIYHGVSTRFSEIEREAYEREQYDATLDLLERNLPGRRLAVRRALFDALLPDFSRAAATDTHDALLTLARSREGTLRLVTTNYDRIFEHVIGDEKAGIPRYPAPLLPIPKRSRWNGLVYLHGLLPEQPDEADLNRLVVTSGDFGLAYLTERWAARFVSELFRNYIVCFVGYSIKDPVLRYMMDALAADHMLGEAVTQAYAFGDFQYGQESRTAIEWKAKGVEPIIYEVPAGTNDHSAMHHSLKAWAEIYRDGTTGKERIVVDHAMSRPSTSTRQDDFVGRMLWALSDKSGIPAKRFAEHDPVPPLEWLSAMTEDRYRYRDLTRFCVTAHSEEDSSLAFSMARRPASYTHAPWMMLVSSGTDESRWDKVMLYMAHWLVRHLDDPALILWLAQNGGHLHEQLVQLIETRLEKFRQLEIQGNTAEIMQIIAQSPNAIPRPVLLNILRLMLLDQVRPLRPALDLYRWKDWFDRDGLTATIRIQLREALAPKIAIKKPFNMFSENSPPDDPSRLESLVDWDLVLASDHIRAALGELTRSERWRSALPDLIDDFQQLLRDALDLLSELGEANAYYDRSRSEMPSITPHWQNREFRDWVVLIEFTRDAWLAVHEVDLARATRIANAWFAMPFLAFKRLALFAASHDSSVAPDQWVEWLLTDDARCLWSDFSLRESLRLLVLQGSQLTPRGRNRLESAILAGPPRAMYPDGIEAGRWQERVNYAVWLRLAKLSSSGGELGRAANERLAALSASNPDWKFANHQREEFTSWSSGTGDPDYEENREIEIVPRSRAELVMWLKRPQLPRRPFSEDTWAESCRSRFFLSVLALRDLARQNIWPVGRWREAFQVWSEKELIYRSWRFVAALVQTIPDVELKEIRHDLAWWLEAVSKILDRHEDVFFELCHRVLSLSDREEVPTNDLVTHAINHPIGLVTQALLNIWSLRGPNDNDLLADDLKTLFTLLCDRSVVQYRYGRVLLASRIIPLYRVDQAWAESYLLPLFNWETDPAEALAAWEGFLWSPRYYRPLLIALKDQFLATVDHYPDLRFNAQQFVTMLTYVALDPVDPYTVEDFRIALRILPAAGLKASAQALVQALDGSGDQREQYWTNHIMPFWQGVWPKSIELVSQDIAEILARLSIAARGEFPSALGAFQDWLCPIAQTHFVLQRLYESDLCTRFPEEVLRLLDTLINEQSWVSQDLSPCLVAIAQAAPALELDPRYTKLADRTHR